MATKTKAKSKKAAPKKAALMKDLRVGKGQASKVQGGRTYGPEDLRGGFVG